METDECSSRVSNRDHEDKHVERHKDRETEQSKSSHKMKDKGRTSGATANNNSAPGNQVTNTIHPIINSGKSAPTTPPVNTIHPIINSNPQPVAGNSPPPGTASNNAIHPIVTKNPAQPTANAPTTTGMLPPNDPVGNTHPTPGANPPTVVTVSNGVTTTQIQNGLGGVSVYSDKPGTITVTNGKESTTLSGGSLTLSGNVVGVGGGQGVEVGPRNGEGNTVVAIKPEPPPPASRPVENFEGNNPSSQYSQRRQRLWLRSGSRFRPRSCARAHDLDDPAAVSLPRLDSMAGTRPAHRSSEHQ